MLKNGNFKENILKAAINKLFNRPVNLSGIWKTLKPN